MVCTLGTTPSRANTRSARFSERTRDSVVPPKAPGTLSMMSAASSSVVAMIIPLRRKATSTAALIAGVDPGDAFQRHAGDPQGPIGGEYEGSLGVPRFHGAQVAFLAVQHSTTQPDLQTSRKDGLDTAAAAHAR